ncbi:MAG: PRTRC system ThiF family protein, partial [Candidatus Sulfotelmatobacter sp.]
MHTILPYLLRRTVKVAVVGCGGTGSAVISGLPHLHQALLAYGHPSGLSVTAIDGDRISATNCVRQPFSASEIGLFKSVVLINRLNLFWGLDWEAVPHHVNANHDLRNDFDLVIGCVDSRAARAKIHETVTGSWCGIPYWLDIGNNADSGQFVLGQPLNRLNKHKADRLRAVSELFPEIIDAALDDDSQPSCSAAEALERQHPFINQTLANHSLALLSRLFR